MHTETIKLPAKLKPVFLPDRGSFRYRCAYGGRGSGKSFTFALMAAIFGCRDKLRILCTRELQVSIKESFHAELKSAIESVPWLRAFYDVGENYIRGANGTEFLFKGLRHNISSVKSTAGIDICIVEEAEDVPEHAWLDLEPTIRAPKSEIWVIWNPRKKGSPVDQRFRQNKPERAAVVELNWCDNPWFPGVLDEQRRHARASWDDALYRHVWEGAYLENSQAQVFHNKYRIATVDPMPHWAGPYYGLDFGFSQDPTAFAQLYLFDGALYITAEAGRVALELDDTAGYIKSKVPTFNERDTVRADCARPESISYLSRHGMPQIKAADKWPGSVEDGITHLRKYREIVIDERCTSIIDEFRNYSYKVDRNTGEITTQVVDAHNHYIDAIRYALQPMIRQKNTPRVRSL